MKENGKEMGNQGNKEHSLIVSNNSVITSFIFREVHLFRHLLEKVTFFT